MLITGNKEGFTFLEVMITMLIIGIVTALILPSFNNYHSSVETKTVQRKVINLFKQLRSEAVVSSRCIEVMVKKDGLLLPDGHQSWLEINEGLAGVEFIPPEQSSRYYAGTLSVEVSQPKVSPKRQIKSLAGEKKIIYYPDGTSSGGSLIITLKTGNSFRIDIYRVSGQAYWREYSG